MRFSSWITLILVVAITGCAAPRTKQMNIDSVAAEIEAKKQIKLALETLIKTSDRLAKVATKVRTGALPICKSEEKVTKSFGFLVWSVDSFDKDQQQAARELYGVTKIVEIRRVSFESAAHHAGLEPRDIPIRINDWIVPVGDQALKAIMNKVSEIMKQVDGTLKMLVRRSDNNLTITITPVEICDYTVELTAEDEKNAYADGKKIVVTRGMMDFFRTDEEAALVVSHELAHNVMGHIGAKRQNQLAGAAGGLLFDILFAAVGVNTSGEFSRIGADAGVGAFSVEFEQEADYVGLYMMALAGYDIDDAAKFWRRMAIQNPKSIRMKVSHPTSPERFVALDNTIGEINEKRQKGLPLEPDMKSREEPKP